MNAPRSLFAVTEPVSVLSREACESITRRVLAAATADETQVIVENIVRCDTRFAGNQVSTSGYDVDTVVRIRTVFGKRAAQLSTNKLDDASLTAAVKDAESLARLTPDDPEAMPMLGPQSYGTQSAWPTTVPTAAERAAAVKAVADRASARKATASGYIEAYVSATAMANSRGLFVYQRGGSASITATVRTADGTGSGWAGANADDWGGIDAAAIGADATQKAERSRNPEAIEPGRYTVLLEPTAVGNLVQLIGYALQARSADEGRSFFARTGGGTKIGLKVVSDRVTLLSDPADAQHRLFGADGLPTEKTVWIEKGIVKNLAYDRFWAQKQGKTPTRQPGQTLRMLGSKQSLPAMIAATERAVLVTRFWYIRQVDPRTILYTGLTRDGTFLIENGKVTKSVKNMRYNDSPIFLLSNLEALGTPVRVSASEDGSPGPSIIMPPVKAYDFNFTSLTDSI